MIYRGYTIAVEHFGSTIYPLMEDEDDNKTPYNIYQTEDYVAEFSSKSELLVLKEEGEDELLEIQESGFETVKDCKNWIDKQLEE